MKKIIGLILGMILLVACSPYHDTNVSIIMDEANKGDLKFTGSISQRNTDVELDEVEAIIFEITEKMDTYEGKFDSIIENQNLEITYIESFENLKQLESIINRLFDANINIEESIENNLLDSNITITGIDFDSTVFLNDFYSFVEEHKIFGEYSDSLRESQKNSNTTITIGDKVFDEVGHISRVSKKMINKHTLNIDLISANQISLVNIFELSEQINKDDFIDYIEKYYEGFMMEFIESQSQVPSNNLEKISFEVETVDNNTVVFTLNKIKPIYVSKIQRNLFKHDISFNLDENEDKTFSLYISNGIYESIFDEIISDYSYGLGLENFRITQVDGLDIANDEKIDEETLKNIDFSTSSYRFTLEEQKGSNFLVFISIGAAIIVLITFFGFIIKKHVAKLFKRKNSNKDDDLSGGNMILSNTKVDELSISDSKGDKDLKVEIKKLKAKSDLKETNKNSESNFSKEENAIKNETMKSIPVNDDITESQLINKNNSTGIEIVNKNESNESVYKTSANVDSHLVNEDSGEVIKFDYDNKKLIKFSGVSVISNDIDDFKNEGFIKKTLIVSSLFIVIYFTLTLLSSILLKSSIESIFTSDNFGFLSSVLDFNLDLGSVFKLLSKLFASGSINVATKTTFFGESQLTRASIMLYPLLFSVISGLLVYTIARKLFAFRNYKELFYTFLISTLIYSVFLMVISMIPSTLSKGEVFGSGIHIFVKGHLINAVLVVLPLNLLTSYIISTISNEFDSPIILLSKPIKQGLIKFSQVFGIFTVLSSVYIVFKVGFAGLMISLNASTLVQTIGFGGGLGFAGFYESFRIGVLTPMDKGVLIYGLFIVSIGLLIFDLKKRYRESKVGNPLLFLGIYLGSFYIILAIVASTSGLNINFNDESYFIKSSALFVLVGCLITYIISYISLVLIKEGDLQKVFKNSVDYLNKAHNKLNEQSQDINTEEKQE